MRKDAHHRQVWLLLLLPIAVLLPNPAFLFTVPGITIDPWVYYGYMRNFAAFKSQLFPHTYYGSRLSWILPGVVLNHLLPPVAADALLHLAVFFTAVFSAYDLLRRMLHERAAFLAAACLGFYPYFWYAAGWDYVDGFGIACYLLTMVLIARAATSAKRNLWLVVAGTAYAALIYSNIAWVMFSPVFPVLYLCLSPSLPGRQLMREVMWFLVWFGAGWAAVTIVFGAINQPLDGSFWFYAPSVSTSISLASKPNPWKQPIYLWVKQAYWLVFPAVTLAASLALYGSGYGRRRPAPHSRAIAFLAAHLFYAALLTGLLEARGNPMLQLYFYASYLIPAAILAFGAAAFEQSSGWSKTGYRIVVSFLLAAASLTWGVSRISGALALTKDYFPWFLAGGSILLFGGIFLRRSPAPTILVLTGFFLICVPPVVEGRRTRYSTENQWRPEKPDWRTEGVAVFRRTVAGMEAVDRHRQGRPVRFWFRGDDPNALEFHNINSSYLWMYTGINYKFPALAPTDSVADDTLVVVFSTQPDVAAETAAAFAGRGQTAHLVGKERIGSDGVFYWAHFFQVSHP
jgi:hypothetical protein